MDHICPITLRTATIQRNLWRWYPPRDSAWSKTVIKPYIVGHLWCRMELGNLVLCNLLWDVDVVPVAAVKLGNFIYSVIASGTIDSLTDASRRILWFNEHVSIKSEICNYHTCIKVWLYRCTFVKCVMW